MYPATIDRYVRPQSIADALAAVTEFDEGEAIFLAGGQSAMQAMKSRMLQPQCIIDLQDVKELRGIGIEQGQLTIGAMTRYIEIMRSAIPASPFAALADAASHVGDRQVRNRGTIGGSVCWNYVAACSPAVVLGLGGNLLLKSASGDERVVAADDFFLGPLETARRDNEILLHLDFPAAPAGSGSCYRKWGMVKDALPVVGVCVFVTIGANGSCERARISLSGLANGAQRASAGETALIGTAGDRAACEAAMTAIAESVETHSDMSASADYRAQLIKTIGTDVAVTAFERARA